MRKQFAEAMSETNRAEAEKFVRSSAIPEAFQGKTVAEYDPRTVTQARAKNSAIDFVKTVIDGGATWSLIFSGGIGTGKTHLACAILRAVTTRGKSGIYVTMSDMLRRIRATWNRELATETEDNVIRLLTEVVVLVIDEVGVQGSAEPTANELSIVSEIIDKRSGNAKPTVVCSNLHSGDLSEWVGPRAMSRLMAFGGRLVPIVGEDGRRK